MNVRASSSARRYAIAAFPFMICYAVRAKVVARKVVEKDRICFASCYFKSTRYYTYS